MKTVEETKDWAEFLEHIQSRPKLVDLIQSFVDEWDKKIILLSRQTRTEVVLREIDMAIAKRDTYEKLIIEPEKKKKLKPE